MNRRSFIDRLAIGAASFMILPGAGRVWRARSVTMAPACLTMEASIYQEYLRDYLLELARTDRADGSVGPNVLPMRHGQIDHVAILESASELDRTVRLGGGGYATIWGLPE